MSEGVVVGPNRYGKQNVRMLRVVRDSPTHEVYALTCAMLLEGNAFTKNYTEGDHSSLIPTETQKNTLYVLSKKYPIEPIERWAVRIHTITLITFPLSLHPSLHSHFCTQNFFQTLSFPLSGSFH